MKTKKIHFSQATNLFCKDLHEAKDRQKITQRIFGTTPDGQVVTEFTLLNNRGLELKVIDYGCTITSLKVPDRNGVMGDIVLGFDHLDGYLQSDHYIGCVIGRFANRIAHGKFSLDGKEYTLAVNQPPHHLHGGVHGFGKVIWDAEEITGENGVGILFRYMSPDGDEGYPGNLSIEVKYSLGDDNTLSIEYHAVTDQQTIINLTQHSYFNLNGGTSDILNHQLTLHADQFLPVDVTMIPTGEIRDVANTPFDFTTPKKVGRDINNDDTQLVIAHGYDHSWVIRPSTETLKHAATFSDESTGRVMDVYTTEPGVQLYTANFLESKMPGKNNRPLTPRMALCLETQHFPDSPNHEHFPDVVIMPGKAYYSRTLLTFKVDLQLT